METVEKLQGRVWIITVGEPLPLGAKRSRLWRTGLLSQILADRGHEVVWWTSRVDHFTKTYFAVNGETATVGANLTIRFLNGHLYKKNISVRRQINHWQIATEFRRLSGVAPRPDLILCSYPTIELSKEAVRLGQRHGIPVIVDVRDLWPDELETHIPGFLRPLGRLALRPMYTDAAAALRGATGLTATSEGYLHWALAIAGRARTPFDGVFTHGYPAPPNVAAAGGTEERNWLEGLGLGGEEHIFWFAGTFVGSIDLETVIEAARRLVARRDILFVISGSGQKDEALRNQARGLPNVVFTGWLSDSQLRAMAKRASVGLAPYTSNSRVSLTNKLFEYMAFGLPVLNSHPGEARTLIEAAKCGRYYVSGSPESLIEEVLELAEGSEERTRMASCALRAFEGQYSANVVYARFADHLERMISRWRESQNAGNFRTAAVS
jgi:glycosyltransferase involved in cell wall biosynthesis